MRTPARVIQILVAADVSRLGSPLILKREQSDSGPFHSEVTVGSSDSAHVKSVLAVIHFPHHEELPRFRMPSERFYEPKALRGARTFEPITQLPDGSSQSSDDADGRGQFDVDFNHCKFALIHPEVTGGMVEDILFEIARRCRFERWPKC